MTALYMYMLVYPMSARFAYMHALARHSGMEGTGGTCSISPHAAEGLKFLTAACFGFQSLQSGSQRDAITPSNHPAVSVNEFSVTSKPHST